MTTAMDLFSGLSEVNVSREVLSAIGRTSKEIAELNREQLLHGKRADGTNMPDYSYISVKTFGKPDGPIMLYDTGAFHSSMQVDVGGDEFEILAEDKYRLEERFGEEIYGLTPNSQEYYNQEVFFPELANSIENQTGLKFN